MAKIKKLSAETIRKIAAGEVVERPASIVKELVENSLDAAATQITVSIKNGGIDYLEVSDNGEGIAAEDLLAAIDLHTTSKLKTIDDLEEISTFGFRGEALASINAAASLEIVTATANGDANRLSGDDGETNTAAKVEPAARNQGTTVIVRNLFRKIPARRKFMKAPHTEELNIRNLFKQLAIKHHKIEFHYIVDGKEIYSLKPTTKSERIIKLFSTLKADDLISLDSKMDGIKVSGYVSHPRAAQKRPTQYLYINGRNVKANIIIAAAKRAYSNKIPPELNPYLFLELTIDPKSIDVNVHPRKEEVKFSDESKLFKVVLHAVENSLNDHMRMEFAKRFAADSNSPYIPTKSSPEASKQISKQQSYTTTTVQTAIDFSAGLLRDSGNSDYIGRNSFNVGGSQDNQNNKNSNYYQIFDTYILMTKGDDLIIIDQHAADERVKYEKFKTQYTSGNIAKTPLLIPIEIELPNNVDKAHLIELLNALEKVGLSANLNENKVIFNHIPTLIMQKLNVGNLLTEILTELEQEQIDFSQLEKRFDRVIATLACHSSIRAGDKLEPEKINKLIADLWQCQNPYTCPHGRPIVTEISKQELEKKFLRIK